MGFVKADPKALGYGGIAQLGEHLLCKQGVIGSSPIISTSGEPPRPIRVAEVVPQRDKGTRITTSRLDKGLQDNALK